MLMFLLWCGVCVLWVCKSARVEIQIDNSKERARGRRDVERAQRERNKAGTGEEHGRSWAAVRENSSGEC
jgi:hypothetical protein